MQPLPLTFRHTDSMTVGTEPRFAELDALIEAEKAKRSHTSAVTRKGKQLSRPQTGSWFLAPVLARRIYPRNTGGLPEAH